MSFHGIWICVQPQTWGVSVGGAVAGMTRHVFVFLATAMVPSQDLVPYANSILCILVSLISHRPQGHFLLQLTGRCFCNSFLVKGCIDMRPVLINRRGQWTSFTTFHFTPTGRKGNCMSKINFIFGITACNCLNINMRLLQDKEMTRDCDQSERVPAEHSSHLIIFIIIYIFKRDLNYIHYIQCLTNLRFLTDYVRFVPLLL